MNTLITLTLLIHDTFCQCNLASYTSSLSTYILIHDPNGKTWDKGQIYCQDCFGTSLATVLNSGDNIEITDCTLANYLQLHDYAYIGWKQYSNSLYVWLPCNNINCSDNTWNCAATDEVSASWHDSEDFDTGHDCGGFPGNRESLSPNRLWHDLICSTERDFICNHPNGKYATLPFHCGPPTNSPTLNPTPTPTNNPTPSPTSNPTPSTTLNPTTSPTPSPTLRPTALPTTSSPTTVSPTKYPTIMPILTPTNNPTVRPTLITISPTNNPATIPTNNPTLSPTDNPVQSPTAITSAPTLITAPTNNPVEGTLNPTPSPTNNPSSIPTDNPIPSPTNNPISSPTNNPTPSPTNNPISGTLNPTLNPSLNRTTVTVDSKTSTTSNGSSNMFNSADFQQKVSIILILILVICCLAIILFIIKRRQTKNKAVAKIDDEKENDDDFTMTSNEINTNISTANPMLRNELNLKHRIQIHSNSMAQTDILHELQIGAPQKPQSTSLSDMALKHVPNIQMTNIMTESNNENDGVLPIHGRSKKFEKETTNLSVYKMEGIDNNYAMPADITKGGGVNDNKYITPIAPNGNNDNYHIPNNMTAGKGDVAALDDNNYYKPNSVNNQRINNYSNFHYNNECLSESNNINYNHVNALSYSQVTDIGDV